MVTRIIESNPSTVTGTAATDQDFESTIEQDFFVLLRFDPWVERFEEQPITVFWTDDNGKEREYTPDALVHFRTDVDPSERRPPMLCEVKPDLDDEGRTRKRAGMPPRKENMAENKLKWEAATHFAAAQGWIFKVFHEAEIRTPYLDNARFLLGYLERTITPHREDELLANLASHGPMSAGSLLSMLTPDLFERAVILPTFYRLVAERRIHADLNQPFKLTSEVSLPLP